MSQQAFSGVQNSGQPEPRENGLVRLIEDMDLLSRAVGSTSDLVRVSGSSRRERSMRVGDLILCTQARWAALAVAAAFVFCYADVLQILQWQWSVNDAYSHGYLVPIISAWLVWSQRERLYQVAVSPALVSGSAVLMVGGTLLVVGRVSGVVGVQEVSGFITLVGLVLLFLGARALRVLFVPIGYLLFMLPVWDIFTERFHYPFQQLSASLGTDLLRLWGVPVHLDGIYLQLPSVTLEVAKVCSGMNYLVAVVAVAIPLAYLSFRDYFRRLLIVGFAIVTAILANSLRVALIGFLAYHQLGQNIHGPGHVLQGLSVAIVAYAAIFIGIWILRRLTVNTAPATPPAPPAGRSAYPNIRRPVSWVRTGSIVVALLLIQGMNPESRTQNDPLPLSWLPSGVGEWTTAPPIPWRQTRMEALPHDTNWRVFEGPSRVPARVYVGNYSNVKRADGSSGYWTDGLESFGTRITIDVAPGMTFPANYAVIKQRGTNVYYLYWYSLPGSVTADRAIAKVFGIWHLLTGLGREPVVVVIEAAYVGDDDRTRARDEMTSFARSLWRLLEPRLSDRPTPSENSRFARPIGTS